MQVSKLRVFQYRNFDREELTFSPGTNIFVGKNGQGKTNLLEALYLLGYGKSFRTAIPRECVQHGRRECSVEGWIEQGTRVLDIQVRISPVKKRLLVQGKDVPIDEFVGKLHILALTNQHLNVIRGGPAERRSFLDRAMITLYPSHLRHLTAYGRALRQRNKLLANARDGGARADEGLLESWEEVLVEDGARIISNRAQYVERMKHELPSGLFAAETLKMKYLSAAAEGGAEPAEIARTLRHRLLKARATDWKSGFTSAGPHRDELKLYVEGKSLSDYGSAGQQRSALISLYFAQMEIHRKSHGFYPLFLMDDVEAELDDLRIATFLSYLACRTQTFLATAKEKMLPFLPPEAEILMVQAGTARRRPEAAG